MTTTPAEARQLLLAAGVPECEINGYAIQLAQIYNEVVMRYFAKLLAERIAEKFFSDRDGLFRSVREKLKS